MIKSITVINHVGDQITLGILENPMKTGLLITNIDGLDAGKVDLNISEYGITDGGAFNSSRMGVRNIVIDLLFVPTEEYPLVERLRHLNYKFFGVKKPVTLIIETYERLCQIDGYVESNTPNIFSDQEGTQISILCPKPFFKSLSSSSIEISNIMPLFEFPFSNESLEDNLIEFGTILDEYCGVIEYEGDYDTGVEIHAIAKHGPVKNFSIYNGATRQKMNFKVDMKESEELIVTTNVGEKNIIKYSKGVKSSVINALSIYDPWIQLTRGRNLIRYDSEDTATLNNLSVYLNYHTLYAGV